MAAAGASPRGPAPAACRSTVECAAPSLQPPGPKAQNTFISPFSGPFGFSLSPNSAKGTLTKNDPST
jgi:hypothetical protein